MGRIVFWAFALILLCAESHASLFIYPKEGQSQEQQVRDQQECYAWAQQQTGYNPNAPMPVYQSQGAQDGSALRGAAGGALRGAAIASLSDGDAGKGAAWGAGMGAVGGRSRSRYQQDQIAAAQNQVVQDMRAQGQNQYLRACKSCLEAKGYTVN